MQGAAERISLAADAASLAEAVADAAQAAIGFGTFGFVPFFPGCIEAHDIQVRSSEFPLRVVRDSLLGAMAAVDADKACFDGMGAHGPGTFDVSERYPRARVEGTTLFREFWVPYKVEQQLVAYMGAPEPAGFFCIARSARERPFTREHLRLADHLRALAERSLEAIRRIGAGDLAATLVALAQAYPSPAFLFDGCGRLRWMSDDGALRLTVESARAGSSLIVRGNRTLELLSRAAVAMRRDPALASEPSLRAAGALRAGERLVVRRFGSADQALLLLSFAPSAPAEVPSAPLVDRVPGLGVVEARVARLAAEGHAVINIAAILGVSESTVRTHLRRVYLKLGVHSRAQLACALMANRGATA